MKKFKGYKINTKKLLTVMQKKKVSFKDLASKAGISPPTVYRLKLGKFHFHIATIARVADVLGIDINELIEKEAEDG